MESNPAQAALRLAFGVHRAPRVAPMRLVALVESDAHAIDICMHAAKLKGAYVAALIGKTESYVSRMRRGKSKVPESLVDALCAALGSNLLRQSRALRALMSGEGEIEILARMLRDAA